MSRPGELSGVVHRTKGVRVIDTEGVLGFGDGWSGPLPEPPAAGTDPLLSVSQSIYTGRQHTRAATRPLAPPRRLPRRLVISPLLLGHSWSLT